MPKESGLAAKAAGEPSYWVVTREPRYALSLVLPMLVIYQAGLMLLGRLAPRSAESRNAAELFLRWVLETFGLGGHLAAGALVVVVLVGWQVLSGRGWGLRLGHVLGMVFESLFYALVLLLSYRVVLAPLERVLLFTGPQAEQLLQQVVLAVGAGVYEEFLFRLLLLGCLCYLLRWAGAGRVSSALVASGLSAVVFSAFHMVGEGYEALQAPRFIFRTFAGLLFASFFFLRGFGITATTHIFFNVILSLLSLVGPS